MTPEDTEDAAENARNIDRAFAAEHDEPTSIAPVAPSRFVRVEIMPDGNMKVDPDDDISLKELVMSAWLIGRFADDMLTGATVARAEQEATRRALIAPRDHRRKSN